MKIRNTAKRHEFHAFPQIREESNKMKPGLFPALQIRANSCNSCLLFASFAFFVVNFFAVNCSASTNDLATALQKGLFEEEANRNFPAAIEAYQGVINRFDEDRKLAATAIFRVGEIYRKQGKTNEANAQYERVAREFSDQSTLATLSQSYLGPALAINAPTTNANSESAPTADEAEEVRKIRAMIRDSPDLINAKDQGGNTRLHAAARLGHLVVSRFLVENGADVNAQEHEGWTPLHIAASGGHKALVELLLSHGASARLTDANSNTPLHAAARKGFRSIVEVLLAHGADVNAKNRTGSTPLHFAAANGFKSVAELLLSHHADVTLATSDARDEQQRNFNGTPLHIAAQRDDPSLAELLLANKANPNATNSTGDTTLHISAARGNQKLADLLLANKADVDPIDNNGETPLAAAAKYGHADGYVEVASLLISRGANVNARNPVDNSWKGWTPLLHAVSLSFHDTTALLLKNGADPNVKTESQSGSWSKGFTPLVMACSMSGESGTVAALLGAKADPNLKTDFGQDPARAALNLPVVSERKRILPLLLDHGADIESRDEQGRTLLMSAVEKKDKEIVELLLARKADVKARNLKGQTALHLAVLNLNAPSGSVGIPIAMPAGSVGTPMSFGERERLNRLSGPSNLQRENQSDPTPDIVEALLAAGAEVNLQDNEGRTALNYLLDPRSSTVIVGPVRDKIAKLLQAHGAVSDLPRLDVIEVRRPEANFSKVIFSKGTNGWDQFTLFDLIGVQYAFLSASPAGDSRIQDRQFGGRFVPGTRLEFPDFKGIRIRRPKPDRKSWDERTVDIETAFATQDCSADIPLQLGEQVNIPEIDHEIGLVWQGLYKPTLETLKKCLTRQVSVIVKGQTNNVSLGLEINYTTNNLNPPGFPREEIQVKRFAPFMIKPALMESKLLLVSSDLSRIKLIRADPASGQKRELIVDCSNSAAPPSVWLRDGDVIEVPDKP
jgi:ankyrin repeat protein